MNHFSYPGLLFRLAYRFVLSGRWIATKPVCKSFGHTTDQSSGTIQQIYVINLDRQALRWSQMQRELQQIYDGSGTPLIELTRRFSAIDSKDYVGSPSESVIETCYSLADQLYVEPQPAISAGRINIDQRIQMTRQEVAVALSHIEVWKRIASGEHGYTLVLEDDVYFRRDFAKFTDQAWEDLRSVHGYFHPFDVLYLSYKEVKTRAQKSDVSDFLFRPYRGLWYLSGYVLSKSGARNLLSLLPVRGPIDLWINHQFEKLNVFATSKSVINQRLDYRSDNLYSILPVLSKMGILKKEKPILFETKPLKRPVFAIGKHGTGLTSLAMALSMLGYRCCSDVTELPMTERENLFCTKRGRVFDAYVNVGSLDDHYVELAKAYPNSRFIVTVNTEEDLSELNQEISNNREVPDDGRGLCNIHKLVRRIRQSSNNLLILPAQTTHKWKSICEFLECVPPHSQYPALVDQTQRRLSMGNIKDGRDQFPRTHRLKFDDSPWIAISNRNWIGVPTDGGNFEAMADEGSLTVCERFRKLDSSFWLLRDDTFPSNLALFDPSNFSIMNDNFARLTLHKERSGVRDYTSASICSRKRFLYGGFEAEIRPANAPGVVTGVFLHRNSPRQEIDIELLGKDTTKLLLNVYYNPGGEGAKFEYGYRGTPVLIDLGFDASEAFHRYRVEWSPVALRWFVDDRLVHERFNWEPTPIPHLSMQFHVNLWPLRSVKLAGRLLDCKLPVSSAIRAIYLKPFLVDENKSKRKTNKVYQIGEAAH
ncbi:MAG: family 16 glycosylhydrolase [Desulfobaccales bacterium]